MERITDDMIIAYAMGELPAQTASQVEERMASDDALKARYEKLRGAGAALRTGLVPPPAPGFTRGVLKRIATVRPRSHYVRPLAAAALICVALGVYWGWTARTEMPGTLTARGARDDDPEGRLGVEVFVHQGSNLSRKQRARGGMSVRPGDGFSFRVYNRTNTKQYLMIWGVDARGEPLLFYPDARSRTPEEIAPYPQVYPLPDGVTPESMPAGVYRIVSWFSEQLASPERITAELERGIERLEKQHPKAAISVLELNVEGGADR